ncbi:MAG: hypothetical protein ACWA6X_14280, partial [Bauldia sp.]
MTILHRRRAIRALSSRRTLVRLGTSVASIALLAGAANAQATNPAPAPGAAAGAPQFNFVGGGLNNERREIVAQFDTDGDGVLDATERAAARAFIAANPAAGGAGQLTFRGPGAGGRGPAGGAFVGPDGVQRAIPPGPDGQPMLPPGFGGATIFGGGPADAAAATPTVDPATLDEATVNTALRAAVVALADAEFAALPAEARAVVVECVIAATAALPIADRQLLVDIGFDPNDEQIARFEANLPGVEAAVRACFPQFATGGPGGRGDFAGDPGGEAQATETGTTGVTLTPADVATYAGVPLYDTSVIRTFFIEFGYDDWEAELEAFYNTDVQVPVTATVD